MPTLPQIVPCRFIGTPSRRLSAPVVGYGGEVSAKEFVRILRTGLFTWLFLILCVATFISIPLLSSLWFWIMAAIYIAVHLGSTGQSNNW